MTKPLLPYVLVLCINDLFLIFFIRFFPRTFIRQIAKALAQQEFVYQESDLFSFSQTKDLSLLHDPDLTALYRLLNSGNSKNTSENHRHRSVGGY